MSGLQASLTSDGERLLYAAESIKPGYVPPDQPWYADNSRESVRDETLRQGFIRCGAVVELKTVATTSSRPRYALAADFAELFQGFESEAAMAAAIEKWQAAHLSGEAQARLKIVRAGRTPDSSAISVLLPSGDTRRLKPGESGQITKCVVEEFATRFLAEPALIWVSESGNKVVSIDDALAKSINLVIDPSKSLPDLILADVAEHSFLLVFVEVVASDGPVSEGRRLELLKLAGETNIAEDRIAFVTAYLDRSRSVLKRNLPDLAWNSFLWFASEPDGIVGLFRGSEYSPRLSALMRRSTAGP